MTTTATKPKRETWVTWMPAGATDVERITRDDLIEELAIEGVAVTARTLMYWEKQGVLPHPERKWSDGAPRVFYPRWFIPAIKHLRELQNSGLTLDKIRPFMRSWALSTVQWADPFADPQQRARAAITEWVRLHHQWNEPRVGGVKVQLVTDDGEIIEGAGFGFPIVPDDA